MNTVEEYFDHVRRLVQNLPDAQAERYEEHILTATRGNLRIRLRFSDNALLKSAKLSSSLAGNFAGSAIVTTIKILLLHWYSATTMPHIIQGSPHTLTTSTAVNKSWQASILR